MNLIGSEKGMIRFKETQKMAKYLKDHPYMEPHGLQENKEDYPEVRDALLNFFPEAEIIDIELIGSSALSPEEREAQDIEKYGFSRGDERDTDLLATITGIDEDDAERWAFSEEAEELEMFYNFDVQVQPERLQEQQDEDDFDFESEPYKESEFTPAQLSVLKNVFDKQFDKIDMDSPEIRKAVYSLNKDGYINFETGELTDGGRVILSDIYGGKYDFETYLFGGLNEKFSKEERKKRAKKCDNPKGFTMKQFCKNQKTRSKKGERTNEGKDPKKGTGKKPKGSGRRLYTDENPKDTVSVKFRTVQDIKDTLSKASFKSKSHKRQSQIINLIHQRARAAYQNAKDPKVKKRLKKAYDYATERKEASKRKTKRMQKENFQTDVKKKHKKMKIRLIGLGGGKNTPGTTKPSYKRSKSAPPGFGGSLEENA